MFPIKYSSLGDGSFTGVYLLAVYLTIYLFSNVGLTKVLSRCRGNRSRCSSVTRSFVTLPRIPSRRTVAVANRRRGISRDATGRRRGIRTTRTRRITDRSVNVAISFRGLFRGCPSTIN